MTIQQSSSPIGCEGNYANHSPLHRGIMDLFNHACIRTMWTHGNYQYDIEHAYIRFCLFWKIPQKFTKEVLIQQSTRRSTFLQNPFYFRQHSFCPALIGHYNEVIMSAMASQITSPMIVHSTIYTMRKSKKPSKLRVTGLCAGNSLVTGEFSAQRASNAENVSIWWRHHGDLAHSTLYVDV